MVYVDKKIIREWPRLITAVIFKKFKPEDIMSKTEIQNEITEIKIDKDDNPEEIFTSMSNIKVKYKVTMTIEEKLSIVLNVCQKYKRLPLPQNSVQRETL